MFRFFINQLDTDGKKLYQKVIDLYKKRIRLERFKTYFELCIKIVNKNINIYKMTVIVSKCLVCFLIRYFRFNLLMIYGKVNPISGIYITCM